MNILLLGSGGREHALAHKLVQSPLCTALFCAPGNPGTARHGVSVQLPLDDFERIEQFCIQEQIKLVVIGPEEPLVKGLADHLENSPWDGCVFGPHAAGARLEGSKAFSKAFMQRMGIPTAAYREFTADEYNEGVAYLRNHALPIVLKADGLAAGKGVVIAQTTEEALETFEAMLLQAKFGEASSRVVVEAFMEGIEISVFALTDGLHYRIIGHAKDYKRVGNGETGPNTGGMGCVTPVPFATETFMQRVEKEIVAPTVSGLNQENIPYRGVLFFGLMNTAEGPKVVEYNCRFGDPETEVILPRLKTDLAALMLSTCEGKLEETELLEFHSEAFVTTVAVSGGYPHKYEVGKPISLEEIKLPSYEYQIYQAGTIQEQGILYTQGGRVLTVTCKGSTISEAAAKTREVLQGIQFDGMYYRNDIGFEF